MPAYTRLICQQRYTIEAMNRDRSSQKEIACAIGVFAPAVSRELRRSGMTRENYCYVAALRHAESLEWKGFRIAPVLWELVETKLRDEQWSPEQIRPSINISIKIRRWVETFTGTCGTAANPTGSADCDANAGVGSETR